MYHTTQPPFANIMPNTNYIGMARLPDGGIGLIPAQPMTANQPLEIHRVTGMSGQDYINTHKAIFGITPHEAWQIEQHIRKVAPY